MNDPYLPMLEAHWDNILKMYSAFQRENPIIEYDAQTDKISAYPGDEYIHTLPEDRRDPIREYYHNAVKLYKFMVCVKDTDNPDTRPYIFALPDEFLDDEFLYESEGVCQGCESVGKLDDVGLCEECAGKFERDLIRQRDWEYSATAFGLTSEQREALRKRVIARFGDALELISP